VSQQKAFRRALDRECPGIIGNLERAAAEARASVERTKLAHPDIWPDHEPAVVSAVRDLEG
jgi:hypothetical protein